MNLAPIILFVYHRPDHTRKTVEALRLNKLASESLLFIFSDCYKNEKDKKAVEEVRNYISTITGFKEIKIILREKNLGLANSVISGVTEVIEKYGKAIVLEDDIVTSPYFLKFINEALEFYKDDKKIYSVSGYNFPIKIPASYKHQIYISPRPSSWGWATWKDRWEKVDWAIKDFNNILSNKNMIWNFNKGGDDLFRMLVNQLEGKIDSWAIRWSYCHFKNHAFSLYPCKSLVKNIGTDYTGTHSKKTNKFNVEIDNAKETFSFLKNLEQNEEIIREFKLFFRKNIFSRILFNIKIFFLRN